MTGYVRAQRDRFDHPLFRATRRDPFCAGYAWDWMVARAAWRPVRHDVGGKTITLRRGQFTHSVRFMAEAWGWDKSAVSRFIARLKTEAMIETGTETGQIVITICNYDKYQADGPSGEAASETEHETAARQQRDSSETDKNKGIREEEREAKASLVRSTRFPEFWDAYPHRNGSKKARGKAEAIYARALRRGVSEQAIIDGASAAHRHPDVIRGYARDPTTWLNQEGWADEVGATVTPFPTSMRQANVDRLDDHLDALKARLAVQRLE